MAVTESDGSAPISIPMPASSGPQGGLLMTDQRSSHTGLSAVEKIESTISDLTTIFQQLAGLVAEQGEMLDR